MLSAKNRAAKTHSADDPIVGYHHYWRGVVWLTITILYIPVIIRFIEWDGIEEAEGIIPDRAVTAG